MCKVADHHHDEIETDRRQTQRKIRKTTRKKTDREKTDRYTDRRRETDREKQTDRRQNKQHMIEKTGGRFFLNSAGLTLRL